VNQWQHLCDHVFGTKQLLILNQSASARRVKPEAGCDKEQQCEPEKKATLSFQAAFTDQLLESSIRNHESVPAYVPKTLPVSSQNQVTDQIQADFRSEFAAGPAMIPY
jgi:hypothetical protein